MSKGIAVIFDGIDGSGKTTFIEEVRQSLIKAGVDCEVYRAPGGTKYGELARTAMFKSGEEPSNETMLLGMMSSHAEFTKKILIPKLKEGKIILLDRYMDSAYAYQGNSVRDKAMITSIQDYILNGEQFYKMRYYITVSVGVSLQRLESRGKFDFFDQKPEEHFIKLDERFKECCAHHQFNKTDFDLKIEMINNEQSLEESKQKAISVALDIASQLSIINTIKGN